MTKKEPLGAHFKNLRYSNTSGKIIPLHHAFLTLRMHRASRVASFVLPIFFVAAIWLLLPVITTSWGSIFNFWMQNIYDGHVSYRPMTIFTQSVNIPYPVLEAALPSVDASYWNLVICIIVFVLSFLVSPRLAPFNYLMRSMLIIQASASIDRMLSPNFFPYTLPVYIQDMMYISIYLLFTLPIVLGFVYYIFDFGLWRKIMLTVFMFAYFLVAIPCQYMLHAYIIHEWTVLFLPIMYLLFGILLDVLMFMSIYSVGMSWHNNKTARQGRDL